MADETKKVYLTFNTRFTHATTTTFEDAQGVLRPLIRVSIPKGTELGGRDLGGSSFLARYALPSKFNEREVSFAFIPGQTVQLSAPVREGAVTRYDCSFRLADLKIAPQEVKSGFGFSILLHEDDGQGPDGVMTLPPVTVRGP